ncbi:MAG: metalloregulator ArsR/SmtB family transcription factor [Rhodospirillales bacterium]|nr:metalloregulator ArsR/SmtB family transcription factor [Rhodospirillales bacterium]
MDDLLNALKAVAEPTRLRILALCLEGELTVSELVRILGQSQPRISRHLKLLSEAGLLVRIREGSWVFHRVAASGTGAQLIARLGDLIPADDSLIRRDMDRLLEVKRDRTESAAAYFREIAAQWDEIRSLHVDDSDIDAAINKALDWQRISSMIDLGTGTGRLLEHFGPRLQRGEGIDMSREMLAIARSNLEAAKLPHCQVRQGDIYQLPNASEGFDLAVIHQVLHFVDDQALAIAEATRVLKPGGQLVVVDFAPHDLEVLRDKDKHRRLGFADSEVAGWFRRAELTQKPTIKLKGSPLTVCIWIAEKPDPAAIHQPAPPASPPIPQPATRISQ